MFNSIFDKQNGMASQPHHFPSTNHQRNKKVRHQKNGPNMAIT